MPTLEAFAVFFHFSAASVDFRLFALLNRKFEASTKLPVHHKCSGKCKAGKIRRENAFLEINETSKVKLKHPSIEK